MGRRRADGGGARAARRARVLRQLAADGRAGGSSAVHGGLLVLHALAAGSVSQLGMARAVSAQHRAGGRRAVHSAEHSGNAGVCAVEGKPPRSAAAHSRSAAALKKQILLAAGARVAENGSFYIYSVFSLTYATQYAG